MAGPHRSSLLEAVGRLQSQLLPSPPLPKLLKLLKELSDLPITLDILEGTGVEKTVNALGKYEQVATFARGLVDKWKKLVPVLATATQYKGPELPGPERRPSRKRTPDTLERQVQGHDGESGKASCSRPTSCSRPPHSPEIRKKKHRKPDENLEDSPRGGTREREKYRGRDEQGEGEKEGGSKTRGKEITKAKEESRERKEREKRETGKVRKRGKVETGEVETEWHTQVEQKEGKRRDGKRSGNQFSLLHSRSCELSSMSHALSPQASTNLQQMSMDYDKPQEKKADHLRPPPKPHIQDKEGDNPKRGLVKPEVMVAVHCHHHHSKGHNSFEKKKAPVSNKEKGKHFELSKEELGKVVSRDEGSNPSSKTNPKEKQAATCASKREKKTEGNSSKKKSGLPSEMAPEKSIHKTKDKDVQKTKVEKFKLSVDSLHGATQKGELTSEVQDKEGSNKLKTQKRKQALNANRTPSEIQRTQESEGDDGFERHSMSFESYLLYDQPKKRRVGKTPSSGSRKEGHPKLKNVKPEMESHSAVKKLPMENSSLQKKNQAGEGSAKPVKSSDGIPALPVFHSWAGSSSGKGICHKPLSGQAIYRPLSSSKLNPAFWLKKEIPPTPQENTVAELPMSRVNSKMKVYSGPRNSCVPKILSLYEQCIKVLRKNIDSIYEVGQVPYQVLTPVLERCSPKQLYRIEDYNPVFLEDSDTLWRVHCSRDFREEQPEEFESWREMYFRLHDSQEQRLRHLTNSIQLAHAKRPKGRQTKMLLINPVSGSLDDVPGREILRLGGPVVTKNASVKAIQHTLSSRDSSDRGDSHAQDKEPSDGSSTSSAHLAPADSDTSSEHSKKTPEKKVAPMVAKSVKVFKSKLARL